MSAYDKEVATTILQQLGGNKFIVMTGAKDFFALENGGGLGMSIPRNKSKANRLKIKLMPDDTYTLEWIKFSPSRWQPKKLTFTEPKVTVLKTQEGVYCDMLQEFFTEYTGMYTHL